MNNKWVYLAQLGNKEYQEVEVTICRNPERRCINDLDSPHGEDTTLCRQVFSTQKLLALDTAGKVNVDTFELPSACVCKQKIRSFSRAAGLPLIRAGPLDVRREGGGFQLPNINEICGIQSPTESIDHERSKFNIET